jgi:hypothetical protein
MKLFKHRDQRNSTIVQPLKCCDVSFEVNYSPAWSYRDRAAWLNHELNWHIKAHGIEGVLEAEAFLALIAEATE